MDLHGDHLSQAPGVAHPSPRVEAVLAAAVVEYGWSRFYFAELGVHLLRCPATCDALHRLTVHDHVSDSPEAAAGALRQKLLRSPCTGG